MELVRLLDEWEVMGLGTRLWKEELNALHVEKGYAPRDWYIIMGKIDMWVG